MLNHFGGKLNLPADCISCVHQAGDSPFWGKLKFALQNCFFFWWKTHIGAKSISLEEVQTRQTVTGH